MILVASAVEANLVNTGLLGTLSHDPAHDRGGGLVAAVGELGPDFRVARAGRRQRRAALVVDHLGVNVLGAAEDGQARTLRRPRHPVANAMLAPLASGLDQQMMVGGVHVTILDGLEYSRLAFDLDKEGRDPVVDRGR